jgi:two-component system chemotaxis response regulator CheY
MFVSHGHDTDELKLCPFEVIMKVMLVEDAPRMREILIAMLKNLGYDDVIEAKHGGEAWEKMRSAKVDLLLTDWNMPIMDGLELVQKVRQAPEYDDLPVLMFTSRGERDDVIHALKEDVDTYVVKPFTPVELKRKIQSILGKRSERQSQRILNGIDRMRSDADHPLVVFGEVASTLPQLSRPGNEEIVRFLSRAVAGLGFLNTRSANLRLGYLLESSTSAIARNIEKLNMRIKLLMLSTQLPGGGITLARLASINKRVDLKVFLVCDMLNEISPAVRQGLDRLGVTILERHRLDIESLEQLFNEYVLAKTFEAPGEVPSPQEIRSRVEHDIRTMVNLPVLPQVYHQIVALDQDSESDMQDWATAVKMDPLSRAQVIRRARSPLYGFQGEINDVDQAVVLLGKNAVKELIVSGAVKKSLEGIEEEGFKVEEYWLHSVGVAMVARLLSFPLRIVDLTTFPFRGVDS